MHSQQLERDLETALIIWGATLACAFFIGLILEIPSALDSTSPSPAEVAPGSGGAPPSHHQSRGDSGHYVLTVHARP